jgi:outer membrane protein OmpA-like peptidoglycan-associated protein
MARSAQLKRAPHAAPGESIMRDLFIAFVLVFIAAASAVGQTTLHYREGQRVSPEEVLSILSNTDGSAVRTRSIRLLPDAGNPDAAPIAATPTTEPVPGALSLPVQFEFDSATILPGAREQLEALAEGIRMLPAGRSVIIEGHTDAVGGDAYNQQLSQRRAASVRAYLIEACGIEARRLRDAGFGKRRPIAGTDPFAPENRRVQFRGA